MRKAVPAAVDQLRYLLMADVEVQRSLDKWTQRGKAKQGRYDLRVMGRNVLGNIKGLFADEIPMRSANGFVLKLPDFISPGSPV